MKKIVLGVMVCLLGSLRVLLGVHLSCRGASSESFVPGSHWGVEGRFDDACGGQRLPNGNTVITAYQQKKKDKAKLFEVNREKKVVWEYINPKLRGIHELHVLTTNGKPVSGPPLK